MRASLTILQIVSLLTGAFLLYVIGAQTETIFAGKAMPGTHHTWAVSSSDKLVILSWLSAVLIALAFLITFLGGGLIEASEYGTSTRPFLYGIFGAFAVTFVISYFIRLLLGDILPALEVIATPISKVIVGFSDSPHVTLRSTLPITALVLCILVILSNMVLTILLAIFFHNAIERYETVIEEENSNEQ